MYSISYGIYSWWLKQLLWLSYFQVKIKLQWLLAGHHHRHDLKIVATTPRSQNTQHELIESMKLDIRKSQLYMGLSHIEKGWKRINNYMSNICLDSFLVTLFKFFKVSQSFILYKQDFQPDINVSWRCSLKHQA